MLSRGTLALLGAMVFVLCALLAVSPGQAEDWAAQEGSTQSGPTLEEYLKEAGPDAKLVGQGALRIDGKAVNCGKRPTVLNPNFDSWGGAFPGFVILNTKKITGLSTAVKLYVYSHECGHQFVGPDESRADCFAMRRGVRWGWLDAQGMEDICAFISTLKGDAVHPPGPKRCEDMRKCYADAIESMKTQSASVPPPQTPALQKQSAPPPPQQRTLAPKQ
jgi:hypothetical protein